MPSGGGAQRDTGTPWGRRAGWAAGSWGPGAPSAVRDHGRLRGRGPRTQRGQRSPNGSSAEVRERRLASYRVLRGGWGPSPRPGRATSRCAAVHQATSKAPEGGGAVPAYSREDRDSARLSLSQLPLLSAGRAPGQTRLPGDRCGALPSLLPSSHSPGRRSLGSAREGCQEAPDRIRSSICTSSPSFHGLRRGKCLSSQTP